MLLVLLGGSLALGSAACTIEVQGEAVVSREEKRFTVSGEPELNLRTFDGSIQLRSWDQKDVRVEIERRGPDTGTAAALVVNVTQTGNRIVIDAPNPRRDEGFHFGPSRSVSLIVTAPRRMRLEARTGDGGINAEDLAGSIVLNTGDGSIRLTRVDGQVTAHTGDGSIRITEAVGTLDANTGDGAIDVTGRFEGVTVRTGDGSVRLDLESGSVLTTDAAISTGDGSIDLRLPATLDAELDAHTGDGRVRASGIAEFTTERRDDRRDDRRTLRARLGSGGRQIRVRSGDGSISISR